MLEAMLAFRQVLMPESADPSETIHSHEAAVIVDPDLESITGGIRATRAYGFPNWSRWPPRSAPPSIRKFRWERTAEILLAAY